MPGTLPNVLCDPQMSLDEKHEFDVKYPGALFMETTPGLPEQDK
jgi:hypothetical protein